MAVYEAWCGRVCSLLEMPTDSCHFPCTLRHPRQTPERTRARKALSATRGLARGGLGTRRLTCFHNERVGHAKKLRVNILLGGQVFASAYNPQGAKQERRGTFVPIYLARQRCVLPSERRLYTFLAKEDPALFQFTRPR